MRGTTRGLEPRFYVDDDVFALERERVFAGSWIPVCRVEDLARPDAGLRVIHADTGRGDHVTVVPSPLVDDLCDGGAGISGPR